MNLWINWCSCCVVSQQSRYNCSFFSVVVSLPLEIISWSFRFPFFKYQSTLLFFCFLCYDKVVPVQVHFIQTEFLVPLSDMHTLYQPHLIDFCLFCFCSSCNSFISTCWPNKSVVATATNNCVAANLYHRWNRGVDTSIITTI